VQVIFSREDDIRHDRYRPATWTALTAGLDGTGNPLALTCRVVAPSITARARPEVEGADFTAVEGLAEPDYAIPNVTVEWIRHESGVPPGYWRAVGYSQNAFIRESFVDELAHAAGQDPFEWRRRRLAGQPRLLRVLELAAERAGWGTNAPSGRARGIAAHASHGSFVAQVVEVSVGPDGTPRVHRVVCAVDCGTVVNPLTVEAQMEGGIVYGLSATLRGEITIERGRVVQSNFHDYAPLRLPEMPALEVHLVPSDEAPGGVGEPGTPPIAPAVTNALFALTCRRVRRLPIRAADLQRTPA
jgi:CO/xanthine dehydrogenase Mo-binding subunit